MQNFKKILLLILVLLPSFFFLSRAFSSSSAEVSEGKLIVSGAGGFEKELDKLAELNTVDQLPELQGTGGFSLGWIKKGNFIRKSDQEEIRVVKNDDHYFLHLIDKSGKEAYLNLSSAEDTRSLQEEIERGITQP